MYEATVAQNVEFCCCKFQNYQIQVSEYLVILNLLETNWIFSNLYINFTEL